MIEPPKEIMLVGKKPRMTANGRESWVDKKILGRCPNIFIKLDFPKPHASDQRSFAVRPFAENLCRRRFLLRQFR
jgi:hypothetical protein